MVGFGENLQDGRRPEWEDAYLDYDRLKSILQQMIVITMERRKRRRQRQQRKNEPQHNDNNNNDNTDDDDDGVVLVENNWNKSYQNDIDNDNDDTNLYEDLESYFWKIQSLKDEFLRQLDLEIEKISLFALKEQGHLADAVGSLRFESLLNSSSTSNDSSSLVIVTSSSPTLTTTTTKLFAEPSVHYDTTSLITRMTTATQPTTNPTTTSTMEGGDFTSINSRNDTKYHQKQEHQYQHEHDVLNVYSIVGVELLHLLRYTSLNSIGIRKILKKYSKVLVRLEDELEETQYEISQRGVGSDGYITTTTATSPNVESGENIKESKISSSIKAGTPGVTTTTATPTPFTTTTTNKNAAASSSSSSSFPLWYCMDYCNPSSALSSGSNANTGTKRFTFRERIPGGPSGSMRGGLSSIAKDDHIHQLSNSTNIVAIQSSLQSAVMEYHYQQCRLAQQRQQQQQQQGGVAAVNAPVEESKTDNTDDDDDENNNDIQQSQSQQQDYSYYNLLLYRFQCIMECVHALRRNADSMNQPFFDFLTRRAMIVTGHDGDDYILGGMDGTGKQFLQWLLQLDPQNFLSPPLVATAATRSNERDDDAVLVEMANMELKQQEQRDQYEKFRYPYYPQYHDFYNRFGNDAKNRFLPLAAFTGVGGFYDATMEATATMAQKATTDAGAAATTPPPGSPGSPTLHKMPRRMLEWGGIDSPSMTLNLLSTLLYTVNYYIIAPTANHYAISLGQDGAYGATLVGASSFSALFGAFLYSLWYSATSSNSSTTIDATTDPSSSSRAIKYALMVSAACPLMGNTLYALAISFQSMKMAILGRILCGFGSAEVINRQVISACVSFDGMTKASALFVAASAIGMSIGPLLAAILDTFAGRDIEVDIELPFLPAGGLIYDHISAPGYVMAVLWLCQLLGLVFFFREPIRINGGSHNNTDTIADTGGISNKKGNSKDNDDVDNDDDDDDDNDNSEGDNSGVLVPLKTTSTSRTYDSLMDSSRMHESSSQRNDQRRRLLNGNYLSIAWQEIVLTFKLVTKNPGLPVTMLVFGYIELADEVLIASCSMVVHRYFGWHGSAAGFLIASLGSLVLPAHFVVEKASHYYSERRIMKNATIFIMLSLLGILNYNALVYDTLGLFENDDPFVQTMNQTEEIEIAGQKLDSLLTTDGEFLYYGNYGEYLYIIFLSLFFMGTIILEGVDTSIMAKVTPPKLNDRFINSGLLATLVGTMGRVLADVMITLSALFDVYLYIDFVNATFFPMFLLALAALFLSKKYYRWLS